MFSSKTSSAKLLFAIASAVLRELHSRKSKIPASICCIEQLKIRTRMSQVKFVAHVNWWCFTCINAMQCPQAMCTENSLKYSYRFSDFCFYCVNINTSSRARAEMKRYSVWTLNDCLSTLLPRSELQWKNTAPPGEWWLPGPIQRETIQLPYLKYRATLC